MRHRQLEKLEAAMRALQWAAALTRARTASPDGFAACFLACAPAASRRETCAFLAALTTDELLAITRLAWPWLDLRACTVEQLTALARGYAPEQVCGEERSDAAQQ